MTASDNRLIKLVSAGAITSMIGADAVAKLFFSLVFADTIEDTSWLNSSEYCARFPIPSASALVIMDIPRKTMENSTDRPSMDIIVIFRPARCDSFPNLLTFFPSFLADFPALSWF